MTANEVVLVTGGTGLIGEAIADTFVDHGFDVIVTSREYERAVSFTDEKNSVVEGERYLPLELELGDERSIRDAVASLSEMERLPSGLIANASARDALGSDFSELSHAEFTNLFAVDIAGHIILARQLQSANLGEPSLESVTFLSSIYANQGVDQRLYPPDMKPTPIHYAAVKSAIDGVIPTLAARWSPSVRVNAVVAGGVRAPNRQETEFIKKYTEKTMLKRLAKPKEIADSVYFLTDDTASYITAQSIVVDGGYSSW